MLNLDVVHWLWLNHWLILMIGEHNLNPLKTTLCGVVDASSCRSLDLLLWTPVSMGHQGIIHWMPLMTQLWMNLE